MASKRVLLSCTVVSLQDTRFLYPCCKFCLSRLIEDCDLRSRCPKCGSKYDAEYVDYRYRLSLKVSRDENTFGVTIFGGCLNSFFGITAGDLQRFVYSARQEGLQSLQHLLIKAVEDCFIGRSFIFGFKISGQDGFLFHEHISSPGFNAESAQFVACQIISPNGAFLGITVFAYMQRLLQASCQPRPSVSNKTVYQLQKEDAPVSSFEGTLPLCSEASSLGLAHSCLWQPVSDLVLCFSSEETSGHSLQQFTLGEVHNEQSCLSPSLVEQEKRDDGVWYAELYPFKQYESRRLSHKSHSTSSDSLPFVSSMADKSDSLRTLTSSALCDTIKPTTTMTLSLESESPSCVHWTSEKLSGRDCNASFLEKPLFSCSFQNGSIDFGFDAPLSETLNGFISTERQIPKEFNTNVIRSVSNCSTIERFQITPKETNCVLLENHMVSGCSSDIQALCSHQSVPTPLHNITNIIREKSTKKPLKRKRTKVLPVSKHCLSNTLKVPQVSKNYSVLSCDIKEASSKLNKLTKDPVSTTCWLPNDRSGNSFEDIVQVGHAVCHEIQSQSVKEQESTFSGYRDEYNCSADLFYQNSIDANVPGMTERAVSDPEIKKDCFMDISIVGPEVLTFHFEPSLQSTPRADQRSFGKSYKGSKKGSNLQCSKKLLTTPSVRVMRNHTDIRQGHKAVRSEFSQTQSSDFSFKNYENLAGGFEVEWNTEHEIEDSVVHSKINEWSRDLFA